MLNQFNFKSFFKNIVIWRLLLLIPILAGVYILPFKASFPYSEQLLEPQGHPLFWSLANFDGVHYLGIADKGYFAQFTQAFFPLYPLLINFVNTLFNNLIMSGFLVSLISLIGFVYMLNKLLSLDNKKFITRRTIFYYLIFPTSFYFAAVYSESLFMFLAISCFYAARVKKWTWAAILGALASATRLFGIILLPALLVELWTQKKPLSLGSFIKKSKSKIALISLSSLGLLSYMYYLGKNFSDPLYFLHAQPAFGAQRSAQKLILLYQVFWRYIKMVFTVDPTSFLYFTVIQEFFMSIIFLVLSVLAIKNTRPSYWTFAISAYLLPTLTGTLSSMPRYVLVLFPAFIILAQIKSSRFHKIFVPISLIFLIINIILFSRGYWVA